MTQTIEQTLVEHIAMNPYVILDKSTIRNLRLTVKQILKALASGVSINELLEDYPELETEAIQTVFLFSSKLVQEKRLYPLAV